MCGDSATLRLAVRAFASAPNLVELESMVATHCSAPQGTATASILEALNKAERKVNKSRKTMPDEVLSRVAYSIGMGYLQQGEDASAPGSCSPAMPQSDPQISIYRDTITGKHMYSPGDDAPGGAAAAAAAVSAEIKQLRRANMKAKRGGTAAGIAPLKLPQHDMAVRWLERSAAAGNEGKAQVVLGCLWLQGWEDQPADPQKALQWLDKACEGDHEAEAQLALGLAWVSMDEQQKAISCLQRAGQELRDPDALYHLGMCLIERDPEEAEQAFTSAAAMDQPDALHLLAEQARATETVEGGKKFALWMLRSAEQGHPEACFALADALLHGSDGLPQDQSAARGWYEKSAASGHAQASCCLGAMYYSGISIPIDHQRAFRWYLTAAKQGSVEALSSLGSMYWTGALKLENQDACMQNVLSRVGA